MKSGLVTLRVNHWGGDLPQLGHFVKSERGRSAFKIVEIKRAAAGARYVAKFICERYRAETLGPQDVVHSWCWAKR